MKFDKKIIVAACFGASVLLYGGGVMNSLATAFLSYAIAVTVISFAGLDDER